MIKTVSSLFSQISSSNLLILLRSYIVLIYRSVCLFSPVFSVFVLANFVLQNLFSFFFFLLFAQIKLLDTLFDSSFSLIFIFFICVFHLIIFKLLILILIKVCDQPIWLTSNETPHLLLNYGSLTSSPNPSIHQTHPLGKRKQLRGQKRICEKSVCMYVCMSYISENKKYLKLSTSLTRKEAMSLKWEGAISLKFGYFKVVQNITENKATGL